MDEEFSLSFTLSEGANSVQITPPLPLGLSLSDAGVSGSVSAPLLNTVFIVSVSDVAGLGYSTFSLEVKEAAPTGMSFDGPVEILLGDPLPDLTPRVNGSGVTFHLRRNLEAGMNFDRSTGTISGTPSVVLDKVGFEVVASNSRGSTSAVVEVSVLSPALEFFEYNAPTLLRVAQNRPIPLKKVNYTSIVPQPEEFKHFSVSPSLPVGLTVDPLTGAIGGVPLVLSPLTDYIVTASNSRGSISTTVSVQVDARDVSVLRYHQTEVEYMIGGGESLQDNFVESQLLHPPLNYTGDHLFSISPALPAGLSFNIESGSITMEGNFDEEASVLPPTLFTVSQFGGLSWTEVYISIVTSEVRLEVAADTLNVKVLRGEPLDPVSFSSNHPAGLQYTIEPREFLPMGITFNTSTGLLSGTPIHRLPRTLFLVCVRDHAGSEDCLHIYLSVVAGAPATFSFDTDAVQNCEPSVGCMLSPSGAGSVEDDSVRWYVEPPLPEGMWIDENNGTISGRTDERFTATQFTVISKSDLGSEYFALLLSTDALDVDGFATRVNVTTTEEPDAFAKTAATAAISFLFIFFILMLIVFLVLRTFRQSEIDDEDMFEFDPKVQVILPGTGEALVQQRRQELNKSSSAWNVGREGTGDIELEEKGDGDAFDPYNVYGEDSHFSMSASSQADDINLPSSS